MQDMLQSKYIVTLYQTVFDFQGPTMIFVHPFDNSSLFYAKVVQFEANKCVHNIKHMDCNMLCLSPGQIITYLVWTLKGCPLPWYTISENFLSMQKCTFILYGHFHDT